MKHPQSNLCVDYIIEHSKAKTWAEEEKICKRYEDILFCHFENPDRVSDKEKRSDLNLMVAMCLFGYHPIFVGDYALLICETAGDVLKNESYIAMAALENLGVVLEDKVKLYIWLDLLTSSCSSNGNDKEPALSYMTESKVGFLTGTLSAEVSIVLPRVLGELTEIMFRPAMSPRLKNKALKCLIKFCDALDTKKSYEVLVE